MGKVLLAFLPDGARDELLDRITFARRGPNTLTSKAALLTELRRIRIAGIAVNNEELAYGSFVAVPVFWLVAKPSTPQSRRHRTMALLDLVARLGRSCSAPLLYLRRARLPVRAPGRGACRPLRLRYATSRLNAADDGVDHAPPDAEEDHEQEDAVEDLP